MHPPWQSKKSNFYRKFLLGGYSWSVAVVNLAFLAHVLRTTTKKVVNFFRKRVKGCTPEKILPTPMCQSQIMSPSENYVKMLKMIMLAGTPSKIVFLASKCDESEVCCYIDENSCVHAAGYFVFII